QRPCCAIVVNRLSIRALKWTFCSSEMKDEYPYFRRVHFIELEHANNMTELEKEIEKAAKNDIVSLQQN
ncbi:MAG: hypothetical protein K6D61_02820, partial [Prevotella sp.]|nr:hypothetical protein [Prevotella sp.]